MSIHNHARLLVSGIMHHNGNISDAHYFLNKVMENTTPSNNNTGNVHTLRVDYDQDRTDGPDYAFPLKYIQSYCRVSHIPVRVIDATRVDVRTDRLNHLINHISKAVRNVRIYVE